MTPALEIEGTWEEVLQRASELNGRRVRVSVINDSRVESRRLTERETQLLERINKPRAEAFNSRYRQLIDRQKLGNLTPDEQSELFRMIDEAEEFDAERLECMIELATLWGITLDQLTRQLGLRGLKVA
jgi:hypothetical protein